MARLRYNGLTATLGAALTSSATAVTFGAALTHSGGTAVPTISGADYIPLTILDSAGNVSEIVSLTAYTSGATTGTISRAQEGTTGVAHSSGDKIVHGPTTLDIPAPVNGRYPLNDASTGVGTNGNSKTLGITTPAAGNYLVACINSETGGNVTSITGGGATWVKLAETTAGASPHCEIWGGVVGSSPTSSVTVNWDATTYCGFVVSEWSGIAGTVNASAVTQAGSRMNVPRVLPTNSAALVITAGAQSGYGGSYNGFTSTQLMWFPSANGNIAAAFGFPGTSTPLGMWANSHGGNFAGVTVALV